MFVSFVAYNLGTVRLALTSFIVKTDPLFNKALCMIKNYLGFYNLEILCETSSEKLSTRYQPDVHRSC